MPPRQQPRSSGNSRRKPSPSAPNGWFWLVMIAIVVGSLYMAQEYNNNTTIFLSDFLRLVENKQLSAVVLVGSDRMRGEVKQTPEDQWPKALDELKPLRGKKIVANYPPNDQGRLFDI